MKNYLARIIGKAQELANRITNHPVSDNSRNQMQFIAGAGTLAVAAITYARTLILGG